MAARVFHACSPIAPTTPLTHYCLAARHCAYSTARARVWEGAMKRLLGKIVRKEEAHRPHAAEDGAVVSFPDIDRVSRLAFGDTLAPTRRLASPDARSRDRPPSPRTPAPRPCHHPRAGHKPQTRCVGCRLGCSATSCLDGLRPQFTLAPGPVIRQVCCRHEGGALHGPHGSRSFHSR